LIDSLLCSLLSSLRSVDFFAMKALRQHGADAIRPLNVGGDAAARLPCLGTPDTPASPGSKPLKKGLAQIYDMVII